MHDPPTLTWLSSCFPETESSLPVGASTNPRNPTLRTASASLARSDETPQPLKIARLLCGCWVAAYGMKTTMMIDESRACMLRALPKWDGVFAAALPPQGRTALMPIILGLPTKTPGRERSQMRRARLQPKFRLHSPFPLPSAGKSAHHQTTPSFLLLSFSLSLSFFFWAHMRSSSHLVGWEEQTESTQSANSLRTAGSIFLKKLPVLTVVCAVHFGHVALLQIASWTCGHAMHLRSCHGTGARSST